MNRVPSATNAPVEAMVQCPGSGPSSVILNSCGTSPPPFPSLASTTTASTMAYASEPKLLQHGLQLPIGGGALLFGFAEQHHRLLQRQRLVLAVEGDIAARRQVVVVARGFVLGDYRREPLPARP